MGYNNRIKNNQISRHIGYDNRIKNNQISRHIYIIFSDYKIMLECISEINVQESH